LPLGRLAIALQNELTAAVDQAFEPTRVSVWLANRAP
jgi:hypothetical protein